MKPAHRLSSRGLKGVKPVISKGSDCASEHPTIERRGVHLETVADLRKYSAKILQQSVLTRAMPLGNKSKMTDEERDLLGVWIRSGMPDGERK